MLQEQVTLYDHRHFRYSRFDGFDTIGETVYNQDNTHKRIIKNGNAPCEVLQYIENWKGEQDAILTLQLLGFKQIGGTIIWERDVN